MTDSLKNWVNLNLPDNHKTNTVHPVITAFHRHCKATCLKSTSLPYLLAEENPLNSGNSSNLGVNDLTKTLLI